MTNQFSTHSVAPSIFWQCRDPCSSKTQTRAGGCHVCLSAANLDVEHPCGFEPRGRRHREPKQRFSKRYEIVHPVPRRVVTDDAKIIDVVMSSGRRSVPGTLQAGRDGRIHEEMASDQKVPSASRFRCGQSSPRVPIVQRGSELRHRWDRCPRRGVVGLPVRDERPPSTPITCPHN